MKKSISIINTGIQLVNCIEAIQHFECTDNYLIIGQFNICQDRIKQIQKMLDEPFFNQHFKKIYQLPFQVSNKNPLRFLEYLTSAIKFAFIILFSKKIDYCFYGVYTDVIMRPITYLTLYKNKNAEICLVDEGVRVLTDAENRIQQGSLITKQEQKRKWFVRDFPLSIIKKWLVPNLTYFTIYNVSHSKRDKIIQNQYTYFKNHNPYHDAFKQGSVIIIGQPFIELQIVESQTYKEVLSRIFNLYNDKPTYYIPHPIETIYPDYIPKNITIVKTPFPIEVLLLGSSLSALIGFNSSVLYNAAKMDICYNILSYKMSYNKIISDFDKKGLERLYQTFTEAGIKIINN